MVSKAGTGAATSSVTAAPAAATQNGIFCGQLCANDFPDMATVTLTATPGTGFVFTGWTGACTGTAKTCTVTMSQSQSVQATFNPAVVTYVLTLTKRGTGAGSIVSSPIGLNCGAVCAAPFVAIGQRCFIAMMSIGDHDGCRSDGTADRFDMSRFGNSPDRVRNAIGFESTQWLLISGKQCGESRSGRETPDRREV